MPRLSGFLPFLKWFPPRPGALKADAVAGVTVALVLIPQSMAYAQLAGMPAYYGLYAAFLPGMVAALWGSSAQLATGPVAVASLLTASVLAPLAAVGSEQFVAYAILLALLVGVIQIGLGVFRLGVVVNFLSHPVIVGFTNAAAIIIGLSQLNKVLGVSMPRSEHFMQDIWGVLQQVGDTHLPSLAMGVAAFAIMFGLRKFAPRLPGVLIAVAVTTLASWAIGFEHNGSAKLEEIADAEVRALAGEYLETEAHIAELNRQLGEKAAALKSLQAQDKVQGQHALALRYEIDLLKLSLKDAELENRRRHRATRKFIFERVPGAGDQPATLYLTGQAPAGAQTDGYRWRVRKIAKDGIQLIGGGEVVGTVPSGLPAFALPKFSLESIGALLSGALVISLVGFMEAISIAKAMAAKTKQRIEPNQELLGQGLANILGSLSQSFPVSGSFSRSAVNLNAGAVTGLSSVFAGLIVLATLLFLTPMLYHLPQAVLAAVIMMAVVGLINFKAIRHAWEASRHDGIAAVVTFIATLAFAPHLDNGILVGAGLAILLYLYRTMQPRVAILGRHPDGTLRDIKVFPGLPQSEQVVALRFDGRLYFANVPYFEDAVLEVMAANPKMKYLLVVADGINELDASGEEVIHHLVQRLRDNGVTMMFSGLKKQVRDVMQATGLDRLIGAGNTFPSEDLALQEISRHMGEDAVSALRPSPMELSRWPS
ncbi:MAG TPA: SulP family inorganic anion transporter [Burkholderiales bacterium]|nr:SulP family inorganic anion transporter [Burkholderiales bacterium]